MKAEIRPMEMQKLDNVKLYNLLVKEDGDFGCTVLDLDNTDLMGAITIAQNRKCKTIIINDWD